MLELPVLIHQIQLVAQDDDGINAEEVEFEIQRKLDREKIDDVKTKWSDQVKALTALLSNAKIGKKHDVYINLTTLFIGLIAKGIMKSQNVLNKR